MGFVWRSSVSSYRRHLEANHLDLLIVGMGNNGDREGDQYFAYHDLG
jgi:hypothetical protein